MFKFANQLLGAQQDTDTNDGDAWDFYFPWNAPNIHEDFREPTSFLSFLRWSYYRPRDMLTMLQILQDIVKKNDPEAAFFKSELFDLPEFRRRYSDYLLGEIKDHLTFYYSAEEYELFLKFFEFLNGKDKFSYSDYLKAYDKFYAFGIAKMSTLPKVMATQSNFLQFLYDLNIICYMEKGDRDKTYIRWCFRERSYANVSPKVKEGVSYQVFYGLEKALNLG